MFTNFLFEMPLLAQRQPDLDPAAGALVAGVLGFYLFCILIFMAIAFIPAIAMMAGMWKLFEKAGHPGWAAIVPVYQWYVMNEIAGKDVMWFILTLVPCANFVAILVISMDVAKNFGKDPAYGVGLALLPFVFFPMLGFGDAQYRPVQYAPRRY